MVKESYHYRWHLAVPLLSLGHFPPQEYSFGSYETQKNSSVSQSAHQASFVHRQSTKCLTHSVYIYFGFLSAGSSPQLPVAESEGGEGEE